MTCNNKALIILAVSLFGLWGCTQGPASSSSQAARLRELESKFAQREDDYAKVLKSRDQARKQAAALEEDKSQLQEQLVQLKKERDQLKLVVKERDQLRQEVEVKTTQRDALQVRCDKMKTGLKSLLGEDDALLLPPPAATITVSTGAQR